MTEKELKEVLLSGEGKIIRDMLMYCANHDIVFSRTDNKMSRLAMRRFYREVIYPHLRELNLNAPRKYEE